MFFGKTLLALSVVAAITACGGGGGGTTAPSTPTPVAAATAEGVWTGTTSTGFKSTAIILENNEVYNIFGVDSNGVVSLRGFDYGVTSLAGNSLNGTIREFYTDDTSVVGSLSATLNAGISLAGSVTAKQGTVTFNSSPIPSTLFSYSNAAKLADVAGGWAGTFLNGVPGNVTITATGGVTGSSFTCLFSGTISPRPSGKNVFDVSITFGNNQCLLPNQSTTGIGVITTTTTGKKQLIVAALNSAKTQGSVFVATR